MCRAPSPNRARVVERLDRGQHAVEVEQRLAHAHEHDVRQPLAVGGEPPRGVADLVDDLGRPRGRARSPSSPVAQNGQPTAQPAWLEMHSVCRSREPGRGRVVHQHRLDERAVVEPVERLLGQAAVGRPELGVGDGVEAERGLERRRGGPPAASASRRSSATVAAPHGVGDLAGAVGGLAALGQPRARASSGVRPDRPGRGRSGWSRRSMLAHAGSRSAGHDGAADDPGPAAQELRPTASACRRPAGPRRARAVAVAGRRGRPAPKTPGGRSLASAGRRRRAQTTSRPCGVSTNDPGHGW